MQRLQSLLVAPTLCLTVLAFSSPAFGQATDRANGMGGAPHGQPPPPELPQTGLTGLPHKSFFGPGADFVQGSGTTRTVGNVVPTQVCPFFVALPAVPVGAVEMASYACWNYMIDGPLPVVDMIVINGVAVQGNFIGGANPDLCWGKTGAVSYLADVTGILVAGGANFVAGACDKPLGADPNALGEGITLLSVFRVSGKPARVVDLWGGYTSTTSSGTGEAFAVLDLSRPYPGGGAHFFANTLDGNFNFGDEFLINGNSVGFLLNGTAGVNNAWVGLAGPLAANNLYDAADDDISPWMSIGDTTVRFRTVPNGDCVGHSFAALSQRLDCGAVSTYCVAKTNSLGCVPAIDGQGYPSATALSGFKVTCTNVRNNKTGLLLYGVSGGAALPFQGGTLCVASPIKRTPSQNSGGAPLPANNCSGAYSIDMNAFAHGVLGGNPIPELLLEGTVVNCQWWGRDQGFPVPNNSMLSAGLSYSICP